VIRGIINWQSNLSADPHGSKRRIIILPSRYCHQIVGNFLVTGRLEKLLGKIRVKRAWKRMGGKPEWKARKSPWNLVKFPKIFFQGTRLLMYLTKRVGSKR
jgi:hypothetical protein